MSPTPIQTGNINNLPNLDKVNYTRLDYDSIKNGIITFIQNNYPTQQNDFFESNAGVMMIDILSYMHDILAYRADFLVNEAYLPTAATNKAIQNLLSLINYTPAGASSSIGTVQITLTDVDPALFVGGALTENIVISTGRNPYQINITDTAGNSLTYEVFLSASDLNSAVIFPAGAVLGDSITATIIEGSTVFQNLQLPANISTNFTITLPNSNIIENSIQATINGIQWRFTANFAYESGPTATFELRKTSDGLMQIVFGDGVFGAVPPGSGVVNISYRIGGGTVGNINRGVMNRTQTINTGSVPVTFNFTNISSTTGGADPEDLNFSKMIAPKNYAAQLRTVTGEDYTVYAIGYKDGTNGSIAKALSIIRPYLAIYGKNNGPYNIDSSNNVIKVKIDDTTRIVTLNTGDNITIEQLVDDFNNKATALFFDPTTIDFEAFAYPTTNYGMFGTVAQPSAGFVTIDLTNNALSFLYDVNTYNVLLPTGDRTYQQIVDDINTQIDVGNNAGLVKFRAALTTVGTAIYISIVTTGSFNPGITAFNISAATNSAYVLLGFNNGQNGILYSSFKFTVGLNYHHPSAAFEVLDIPNNAYATLGLAYSISNNGLGRALPMAANYVDIYVMALGSNNTLTQASDALKAALANFINRFKVLTDKITIVDGLLKVIGINITVYVDKAYDITSVKNTAQLLLDTYMAGITNNFGDAFYISKVYELLESINGVDHALITDITENKVSQLTTGNGQIRDITTKFNEVWTKDFINLTAVFN